MPATHPRNSAKSTGSTKTRTGKPTTGNSRTGRSAMIMAAGLGTRMRPLSEDLPKPLVMFDGMALIDHALARLRRARVEKVVANVHYKADLIEAHLKGVGDPEIVISDERERLLNTGGGIAKALPHLGADAFFVMNVDSVWAGGAGSNMERLREAWVDSDMDCLLLLAPTVDAIGYGGAGDFMMNTSGRLRRAKPGEVVPFVNTGVYLVHPRLFEHAPDTPFSINELWDRALEEGRLYGVRIDGTWMHLGSPDAIRDGEALIREITLA